MSIAETTAPKDLKGFLSDPKTVAIVGCPFSGGQPKPGVDHGPIHLVNAGLEQQLAELGWKVKFDGHHQFEDIDTQADTPIGILKRPRLVSKVTQAVAEVVGAHAQRGELPLTLGGDHSLVSLVFAFTGLIAIMSASF
ncbi:Arginase, catabolizes arginine to ornithine and urea [Ceratobasidium sp. 394]|nr:Arginase, catabolizes arginine to ornithine and urea [Ceratobasidium sp. 394]